MKILLLISILAMSTNSVFAGNLSTPASPLAPVAIKRKVGSSRGEVQVNSFDEENEGKDVLSTMCYKYHDKMTKRVQTFWIFLPVSMQRWSVDHELCLYHLEGVISAGLRTDLRSGSTSGSGMLLMLCTIVSSILFQSFEFQAKSWKN